MLVLLSAAVRAFRSQWRPTRSNTAVNLAANKYISRTATRKNSLSPVGAIAEADSVAHNGGYARFGNDVRLDIDNLEQPEYIEWNTLS